MPQPSSAAPVTSALPSPVIMVMTGPVTSRPSAIAHDQRRATGASSHAIVHTPAPTSTHSSRCQSRRSTPPSAWKNDASSSGCTTG